MEQTAPNVARTRQPASGGSGSDAFVALGHRRARQPNARALRAITGPELNPFDEVAIAAVCGWLREGLDTGADPATLRAEIAGTLWPWARRFGVRALSRLPPYADAAEVQSRVAMALWQCCERFEPTPAPTWAIWLSTRLRGAVLDAARAGDRLSRRDRRRVREGTAEVLVEVSAPPLPLDEAPDLPDPTTPDPGRVALDHELAEVVRTWLRCDLPPALAARLCTWWQATGAVDPLPTALAAQLQPYLFRLLPAAGLLR